VRPEIGDEVLRRLETELSTPPAYHIKQAEDENAWVEEKCLRTLSEMLTQGRSTEEKAAELTGRAIPRMDPKDMNILVTLDAQAAANHEKLNGLVLNLVQSSKAVLLFHLVPPSSADAAQARPPSSTPCGKLLVVEESPSARGEDACGDARDAGDIAGRLLRQIMEQVQQLCVGLGGVPRLAFSGTASCAALVRGEVRSTARWPQEEPTAAALAAGDVFAGHFALSGRAFGLFEVLEVEESLVAVGSKLEPDEHHAVEGGRALVVHFRLLHWMCMLHTPPLAAAVAPRLQRRLGRPASHNGDAAVDASKPKLKPSRLSCTGSFLDDKFAKSLLVSAVQEMDIFPGCSTPVSPLSPDIAASERVKRHRNNAKMWEHAAAYQDTDDPDAYISSCSIQ